MPFIQMPHQEGFVVIPGGRSENSRGITRKIPERPFVEIGPAASDRDTPRKFRQLLSLMWISSRVVDRPKCRTTSRDNLAVDLSRKTDAARVNRVDLVA